MQKSILLAACLAIIFTHGAWAFLEVQRPCADGCQNIGNCNHEFGTCECPFGRKGPTCETHLLGACRTSADPRALPFIGIAHPKSCQCIRQLYDLAYSKERRASYVRGTKHVPSICYERKGVAEELQFSDPPALNDPNTRWGTPGLNDQGLYITFQDAAPEVLRFRPASDHSQTVRKAVPLSECPSRCNERGSCVDGHCRCMQGIEGASCELAHTALKGCMNKCSGHGQCLAGFCHCKLGHWGQDCSRSRAYEPDPARPSELNGTAYNRTDLRIYRLELPWEVAFPFGNDDTEFGINDLYGAFEHFYTQFAVDTVVRTDNPGEANLFYVPLLDFYLDDNAGDVFEFTRRAMRYLQQTPPFAQLWARNEGRDHFFWLPGDLGACWLLDEPEVQNPIKVVHWALQINASDYTHMPHYWWVKDHPVNKEYHCFKQKKDVVTPNWIDDQAKELSHADMVYKDALAGQERRYLLFFGGGIRHNQVEYSGGARQAFDKHVISKQHPEILFGGGREAYKEATFCLAPYGDGWGSRLPHIMQAACIPVIVQEYVHQSFDDVLHYEDFSLRLQVADMPRLMEILKAVTPAEIQRYREKMFEVHKAFHWMPSLGGQAYNYTLLSLQKKLFNLWSMHY